MHPLVSMIGFFDGLLLWMSSLLLDVHHMQQLRFDISPWLDGWSCEARAPVGSDVPSEQAQVWLLSFLFTTSHN